MKKVEAAQVAQVENNVVNNVATEQEQSADIAPVDFANFDLAKLDLSTMSFEDMQKALKLINDAKKAREEKEKDERKKAKELETKLKEQKKLQDNAVFFNPEIEKVINLRAININIEGKQSKYLTIDNTWLVDVALAIFANDAEKLQDLCSKQLEKLQAAKVA